MNNDEAAKILRKEAECKKSICGGYATERCAGCKFYSKASEMKQALNMAVKTLNRKAKWIFLEECSNDGVYCSICGKKVFRIDFSNTMQKWKNFKFCPNCGARMEASDDKT